MPFLSPANRVIELNETTVISCLALSD